MKSEHFPEKIVAMTLYKDLIYIATEYSLWLCLADDASTLRRVEIELPEDPLEPEAKKEDDPRK